MEIMQISGSMGYPGEMPGASPRQTLSALKSQRKELQDKMQNSANEDLAKQISTLDKRIENLQKRVDRVTGKEECQTCKNRKYQDGSDDPGVSFKNPSRINGDVGSAVRSHENEHVTRNRAKAQQEGKEIVSQSVTIKNGICPECGKSYVSGGETVTVTRQKAENPYNVGIAAAQDPGSILNMHI